MKTYTTSVGLSALLAIALVSALACGGAGNAGGGVGAAAVKPEPAYGEGDSVAEVDVQNLGEEAVKAFLKFPRDAEFDRTDAEPATDGTWVAFGRCKAMNAFGARITYDWRATFVLTDPAARKWKAVALVLNDEVAYANQDALAEVVDRANRSSKADSTSAAPTDADATPEAGAPASAVGRKPEPRTWSSADGKFTTDAEFAGAIGDEVKLKKVDGTVVKLKRSQLSEADRAWLEERAKGRGT